MYPRALLLALVAAIAALAVPMRARADVKPLPAEYSTASGPGFVVGYHPSARERVERLVPEIGAARAELEWQFGRALVADLEIRIAGLDVELPQLAGVDAFDDPRDVTVHGGVLVDAERLIVLSAGPGLDGAQRDLEIALRYQLARLALRDAVPEGVPDWFADGYAVQFAHGVDFSHAATLVWAAVRGDLPHVGDRRDDAVGAAFAAETARFVAEFEGGRAMQRWTVAMRDGEGFDEALGAACGDVDDLDAGVRDRVRGRVAWVSVLAAAVVLGAIVGATAWLRRRRRALARARARALVQAPALALIDPILGVPELVPDHVAVTVMHTNPERVHHDGSWHTLH